MQSHLLQAHMQAHQQRRMSLPHHDEIWDYAMTMNMEDPFSSLVTPSADDDEDDDFLMIVDDMDDEDRSEMSVLDTHRLSSNSASFDDLELPEDSCYPMTPPTFKNSYLGDLPPMVSPDMSESSENAIGEGELREQYNCTLQKLADSMRRSEATRFELLRQQQLADATTPPVTPTKNPDDVFLSTASRSQLWTFIHAHNIPEPVCS